MKKIVAALSLLISISVAAQPSDEAAIKKLLNDQAAEWSKGNVEGFMEGYWKNDSMMFIGKNGVNWGWQKTLKNYKRSYPDTASMGQLHFDLITIKRLSPEYYYVVGKWMLKRSVGNLEGHFNLLLKKINGRWLIVADHSS